MTKQAVVEQSSHAHDNGRVRHVKGRPIIGAKVEIEKIGDRAKAQAIGHVAERDPARGPAIGKAQIVKRIEQARRGCIGKSQYGQHAQVLIAKYCDHTPLYRQSQIMARSDVKIERSTLAQWVGAGAFELQPLHDYLLDNLKASPKLFCDETRCPVLDPGRGKTKSGFLWALARDDRPWGGNEPPAVAYSYAPGRGAEHAIKLLAGFSGVLQVDGYSVYKQLTLPTRKNGVVVLAYCWSHLRRKFYELYCRNLDLT